MLMEAGGTNPPKAAGHMRTPANGQKREIES